MTVYAHWTSTAKTYSITYELNGGTNPDGAVESYTYGKETTLPTPEKTGYTFDGWYDGETKVETITSTDYGAKSLKAQWKANTYTVKFDKNEGEGTAPESITATYDVDFQLPSAQNLSKTGFTFGGWNKEANGSGTTHTAGSKVKNLTEDPGAETTLYAVWLRNKYTVTFDSAGGSEASDQTVEYQGTATEPETTRGGYTFDGWYNGVTKYDFSTRVTENITLTAHWTRNPSSRTHSTSGTYIISLPSSIGHGSISVSPTRAGAGTTVTVTVQPDKGYTLETLIVSDRHGNRLDLKSKGNNQYTFRMPSGSVTVTATFMEDNSMRNFFVDVPTSSYYYNAVLWAAENGITSGTSATTFSPNSPCTRGQMATFLWRLNGSPKVSGTIKFKDVDKNAYYHDAVLWCWQQGITAGTSDTTFSPENPCTRGQMAMFLYRMRKSPGVSGKMPFVDVKESAYYYDAVLWAWQNKITSGTSAGENATYSPDNPCTRGQTAVFLYHVKDVK